MEQLVTFLFFIVLAIYLIRWIIPVLLRHYIRKRFGGADGVSNVFGDGSGRRNERNAPEAEEGKVSVSGKDAKNKIVTGEMGEYVDFVEEKNKD